MTTIAAQIDPFIAELERRKFRPNTVTAYISDLRIAARSLPQSLDQITLDALEAVLEVGNVAPATVTRRAASLKRFFAWAKKQGLCAVNPLTDREPTRSATRRLPRPISSTTDLAAIDMAIAQSASPYRLIFTILRETGMRIGEVLALQRADVCLEPGREGLRVREPKNGNERIVLLGAKATPRSLRGLRTLIKELKDQPGYVPLFRSNRGTAVSYQGVTPQTILDIKNEIVACTYTAGTPGSREQISLQMSLEFTGAKPCLCSCTIPMGPAVSCSGCH